jgi:hypothetical protein
MASRVEDLTVAQGTDASFKIYLKDSAGASLDVSTKLFSASMKKSYTSTASIDFTTAVNDAPNGVMTISLTKDQTTNLDEHVRYVYDVMMYEAGNTNVEEILNGKVFIKPTVTRLS